MNDGHLQPFHWCDRRCERCPLARGCPVFVGAEARDREARRRGLDPTPPRVVVTMIGEDLQRAFEMTQELSREPGEAPPVCLVHSLAGERLAAAGASFAEAVLGLCSECDARGLVEEARIIAVTLSAKSARCVYDLPLRARRRPGDPQRTAVAMSLLCLEALLREADVILGVIVAGVRGPLAERAARARLRFGIELGKHLPAITRVDRLALSLLKGQGRAPSPFCVVSQRVAALA